MSDPKRVTTAGAKKRPASNYLEQWQRAQAELENLKKRTERERAEFARFATRELVLDLLPILDNFDRALAHAPAGDTGNTGANGFSDGISFIRQQLLEALAAHGVTKLEAKPSDPFDAERHHAVERRADAAIEPDHLIQIITPAYALHGQVIRPASVVVAGEVTSKS